MVVARSSKDLFDYIPVADRDQPKEKQTTFHLRPFPTHLQLRAQRLVEEDKGHMAEVVVRAGIANWTNFVDAGGKVVECKHEKGVVSVHGVEVRDPLTLESMDWISQTLCTELAVAIWTGNTLTDDDVKN